MAEVVSISSGRNSGRMENVEELMRILLAANKLHERQQIDILMNQIGEMEKNYAAIMQELADIKGQLNEVLKDWENFAVPQDKAFLTEFGNRMESNVQMQRQKFENVKQDLNTKAQKAVQGFKDFGVKALNNICNFLGVQEKLIELRDQARSSEMEMRVSVEKIDAVNGELSGIASKIRNVGRIIADKEALAPEKPTKDISMFQRIRNHCLKRQEVYAARVIKLDRAIENCKALEQKASVLGKLADNKQHLSDEKNNEDKQNVLQTSDHKRDENVR